VRDLIEQKDLGDMVGGFTAVLEKHTARMLKVACP
jgi:hypothetical protein